MLDNFLFFGSMIVLFYGLACSGKFVYKFLDSGGGQPPIVDMLLTVLWMALQVFAFAYLVKGGSCGH